ncbi:extracellular solute-binding protein [Robinsoniella sp. KNHs210]|uniref:extracellular solute-binding protein n=1 Tax=Robinsoniella sp. KNHs210 TaxID=1469950 RepID=UPI000485B0F8|nr:extracellular solute-binding protein [Robinsoniella sp. KNHs210]
MKSKFVKRLLSVMVASAMVLSMLSGCGSSEKKDGQTASGGEEAVSDGKEAVSDSKEAVSDSKEAVSDSKEVASDEDIEVWGTNTGYLPVEAGSELYNLYKEMMGVGIVQPYVEWNGGETYLEQLNLRIAAGDMPDVFSPWNGIESELIESGALLDLTDLLQEKAPHLWESIPEEMWDAVKANDPTGENRIYVIPQVLNYGRNGGMIRQDWLDSLGLKMPTTQEEFVEVLRAFKNDDPNGNGVADEIATGGRAEVRWMGQMFGQYGIAMWEGYPQWDIYDGELTYSAVTQNMKDCLEWMSELYAEGLLDPETLLNDKSAWDGKINSGVVGVWEHLPQECYNYAENIYTGTGVKPQIAILPAISAPGYEGYYTHRQMNGGGFVVANTEDEEKIDKIMKVLDAYGNQDMWMEFYNGVEGMHSEVIDGKAVRLPDDPSTQQNLVLAPYNSIATIDFQVNVLSTQLTEDREWAVSQAVENVQKNQEYVKSFAGDGMPDSIYSDFPDIGNRTLYVEYATKIIAGEYPIDKFDEFVEKWYASGGKEVTELAREWYANKTK